MSTNRFWHRGISLACLGVFSLFLMTAATGCNNCCMRKGDGDNQTQAGFAKCGVNCTKACGKQADAKTTQAQAGYAKCGVNFAKARCQGKANTVAGATTAAVNKTCPISGRSVSAGTTVSYGEKTVGFCCGGCISKWNALTDADKTSKLTGA